MHPITGCLCAPHNWLPTSSHLLEEGQSADGLQEVGGQAQVVGPLCYSPGQIINVDAPAQVLQEAAGAGQLHRQ